jgi:hypothetical protein
MENLACRPNRRGRRVNSTRTTPYPYLDSQTLPTSAAFLTVTQGASGVGDDWNLEKVAARAERSESARRLRLDSTVVVVGVSMFVVRVRQELGWFHLL